MSHLTLKGGAGKPIGFCFFCFFRSEKSFSGLFLVLDGLFVFTVDFTVFITIFGLLNGFSFLLLGCVVWKKMFYCL